MTYSCNGGNEKMPVIIDIMMNIIYVKSIYGEIHYLF